MGFMRYTQRQKSFLCYLEVVSLLKQRHCLLAFVASFGNMDNDMANQ